MTENENNTEQLNGSIQHELPESLFVQHLATYPAVVALTGLVSSFPAVKVFTSNAIPLMMAIRDRSRPVSDPVVKRASPVVRRADEIGNSILTKVDDVFPSLQKIEPNQVIAYAKLPVERTRETVTVYSTSTRGFVNNNVIQPLKSATHAARSQYSKVYDNQGKALIRARFDPYVSPLNDKFESAIVDYLPNGEEEFPSSNDLSNELSRTWRLARCAVRRARPVVTEQTNNFLQLPHIATEHVKETYQAKIAKHSVNGTTSVTTYALAYLGTTKELYGEILTPIRNLTINGTTHDSASDITINENDNQQGVISRVTSLFSSFIPSTTILTNNEPPTTSPAKIPASEIPTVDVQEVSVQGELH